MTHFISAKLVLIIAILAILSSCTFHSNAYRELQQERDSLAALVLQKDSVADAMNGYLEVISSSLDSIKMAEDIYTLAVDKDGRRLNNTEIKDNLALLEDVIHRQRSRIENLEAKLRESQNAEEQYKVLIANLYAQIDEKDAQIRRMQVELERRDRKIVALNTQVKTIQKDLASAEEKNKEQGEMLEAQTVILTAQDKMANTGYIISGTRRELQQKGALDNSLFPKLQPANFAQAGATQVDMREFKEIKFDSMRAKVLTQMPADSYTIVSTIDGTTLTVTDPGRFWSVTSYLVIQF